MQELLDELFGAVTGCCKGKGGSMHMGNMAKGMIPGIAIVAGGIPVAAGMALAFKMQKTGQIVACFFGDGAVAEGAFHEGVNMAAIWNLPVIFALRKQSLRRQHARLEGDARHEYRPRAAGYGIRGQQVDGNDVLAVYEAAKAAAEECRARSGARAPGTADLSPRRAIRGATRATTNRRTSARSGPPETPSNGSAGCS